MAEKASMARLESARPLRPQQIGEMTRLRPLTAPIADTHEILDRYEPETATIAEPEITEAEAQTPRRRPWAVWFAAALGIVAVAEGGVIAKLAMQPSVPPPADAAVVIESPDAGDTVLVDGKPLD
jgi:hypothetical protein